MKKYITLLLAFILIICCNMVAFAAENNTYIASSKLGTYKHNEEKIIYGFNLENNKIIINDVLNGEYFTENVKIKVFNISGNEISDTRKGLGTGSKIKLYQNEEIVSEYTVVIYGDITGDGEITAIDALALIKAINNKIDYKSSICEEAGKIITTDEGKTPTAIDALAIIKHLNGKYEIKQADEIKHIDIDSILDSIELDTEEVEIDKNGDEDADGLTNSEEYELGTDIFYADTDADGLSDYEEVKTYNTNPLKKDTDEDGIEDLNEILLGLNPLSKDSDGDGILDNEEKVEYAVENTELGISISMEGNANISDTQIDTVELNELDDIDAIVSDIYSFNTSGKLDSANVEISYDENIINEKGIAEEDLSLYYFDPTNYTFEEVATQIDTENNVAKATLEHFSMYILANKKTMISSLSNQIMFVIDNSGSMYTPEQAQEKATNDISNQDFSDWPANDPEYKRLEIVSKLINKLDDNFEYGVSKFTADYTELCKMGSSNEKIEKALEKIKTDGENFNGTYTGTAVYMATFHFPTNSAFNRYIVLISDGVDTSPSKNILRDWAISTAKDKNVKIITIGLGENVDQADLRKYAEETGGRYYHVDNADMLDNLYSSLYSELNLKRDTITTENGEIEDYLVVADSGFTSEVNGLPFKNFETLREVDNDDSHGNCYGIAQLAKKFYNGNLELTGNTSRNYMGETINFNYDLNSIEFFTKYNDLINYKFKSEIFEKIFKSSREERYDFEKLDEDLKSGVKKIYLEMNDEFKEYIEQTNGVIKIKQEDNKMITGYGKGTADVFYIDMEEFTDENIKKFLDLQLFKAIEYLYMTQVKENGWGPDYDKQIFFENPNVLDDTIERINNGTPVVISYKTYSSSIGSTFQWLISHADHAVNGIRILRNVEEPNKYKIAIYNNNRPGETEYLNVEKVKTLFGTTLCCYEQEGHCTNIYVEK